jgi:hypothetical protein
MEYVVQINPLMDFIGSESGFDKYQLQDGRHVYLLNLEAAFDPTHFRSRDSAIKNMQQDCLRHVPTDMMEAELQYRKAKGL